VDSAILETRKTFNDGKPISIYDFDNREGETDLVYPAVNVTPEDITRLRNDAGGLICVALSYDVAESFDLPLLAEELTHPASECSDIGYDKRSSFSFSVNHRETYTGITDVDRALTITKLGEAARNPGAKAFADEFRIPGHVHLLKAAPNLLADRQGHTEFGVHLAEKAGYPPAVVVCEMLDDETGQALSKADARCYARQHDIPFFDGENLNGGRPESG
jgi:3,4-dihydroxy 2-butanone 4-phosphate synthase